MVYFSQVVLRQLSRDEFLEFKNQTKLRQGYIQGRKAPTLHPPPPSSAIEWEEKAQHSKYIQNMNTQLFKSA